MADMNEPAHSSGWADNIVHPR